MTTTLAPRAGFDLTGRQFGRWTVLRYLGYRPPSARWLCRCACGKEVSVSGAHLRSGASASCGCALKTSGGHAGRKSPTYTSWLAMLVRCRDRKHPHYARYGARGITVCERWRGEHGFQNFLGDMGERPPGKTLDRFPDGDGNYEPGNVRWATPSEQGNNTAANHALTVNGETHTLAEWAERAGIADSTLRERLRSGWDPARAVARPARSYRKKETCR